MSEQAFWNQFETELALLWLTDPPRASRVCELCYDPDCATPYLP